KEIEKRNVKTFALKLDVGKSETFPKFREDVLSILQKEWGTNSFDYLVNNAGFGKMTMFVDTKEDLFDEFYRVLLKGPYFLTQTLLGDIKDGDAIVNTSSNSTCFRSYNRLLCLCIY